MSKSKKIALLLIFLVFISSYLLFVQLLSGNLEGDFVAHLANAKEEYYYSLIIVLMKIGINITDKYIYLNSILMSIIIILTIWSCYSFIHYVLFDLLNTKINKHTIFFVSVFMLFVCKICIPVLSPFFYVKSYVTQPWHNSTYICMRLFAVLALIYFIKIQSHYLEHLEYKELIIFTILLTITNYSKPNFIIVFAPMMLITLIYDFIKTKTKSFKNAFIFGCCILVGCLILIYQYALLFSMEEGSGTVVGIENIKELLFFNYHDIFNFLSSLAFPLAILLVFITKKEHFNSAFKRVYLQSWFMYILSILIRLFVYETGRRSGHGNYGWSSYFFAFVLFCVSICILLYLSNIKKINNSVKYCCFAVYTLHILSGIIYFVIISTNTLVYMT